MTVQLDDVDLEAYLRSKNLSIKRSGSQIYTTCCFCNEDPGKRGRLYFDDSSPETRGLYHCLAGETRVITFDGTRTLADLAQQTEWPKLLTSQGWKAAPVYNFGKQRLYKVSLQRNGIKKELFATAEHRWFRDGKRGRRAEVLTTDLKPGHALWSVKGQGISRVRPSAFGIARGFTFGDGTNVNHGLGSSVRIFGEKIPDMLPFYPLSPRRDNGKSGPEHSVNVSDLPTFFKRWPSIHESRSYLYGWLAGYFAADGHVDKACGNVIMNSAFKENLEFFREVCTRLGIRTYGITFTIRLGKGEEPTPLYSMRIIAEDLDEAFFLRREHHRNYVERSLAKAYVRMRWVVKGVEETDRVEDVFCAVVESTGDFALEDHILTGNCKLCDARGNMRTLRRHFGDPVDEKSVPNDRRLTIVTKAARFYHNLLEPQHRDWLHKERGLTDETIDNHLLGYAPGGDALWSLLSPEFEAQEILATGLCSIRGAGGKDFLADEITIPYMVGSGCAQIRGKRIGGKYRTPPGQQARLFNTNAAWGAEEVVICEGEADCCVLEQMGYSAVAAPGAGTWQASWNGYFDDAKKIFVLFDPDDAGRAGASRIKDVFGARAKVVDLPVPMGADPGKIDPSELYVNHGWTEEDFASLFQKALRKASLLIRPSEAREDWESWKGQHGLKLGFELLDHLIAPGLLQGQVMIPLAKTNSGKSIAMLNMLQRSVMAEGQGDSKLLLLSLEQTASDWFERAQRIWNFYNLDCEPDKVLDESTKFWEPRLRIVEKNRVSMEEMSQVMSDFHDEMGDKPDLVIIDYLGYWARSFPGKDRYEKTSEAIMTLKEIAKEWGIRVISPHQVNRGAEFGAEFSIDSSRDAGVVEETADFAIPFWAPDTRKGRESDDFTGELIMKIGKSRHGGKGHEINLQFAPMSLVMVPREDTENVMRARSEVEWVRDGRFDWKDAIHAHRTGLPPISRGF